jgi:two-component system chemotaxis sensor kinase CheA
LEDGLKALDGETNQALDFEVLLELHDALRDAAEQVQDEDRSRVDPQYWRERLNQRPGSSAEVAKESVPPKETPSQPEADGQPHSPAPPSAHGPPNSQAAGKKAQGGQVSGQGETGKTQNVGNRGTMRVSADRLERLSEGVIGLAMDRATQEDRRSELDQLVSEFRALRQQWEWFEETLPATGPLVEQKKQLSNHLDALNQQLRQFRQETELDLANRHSMYDEIHQRVMDLMVTPLGNIFSVLPRSARDLAQRFQKRVELTIEGSEIELERRNVDALLEPLVHLVTNAISHGIEDAEERQAAGKDPVGHIRVQAEQMGGEVAISVSDDGRGIDYEKVRETAIRTGVTTATEAENMLPYDLLQMLFRPGFSTKEEVSQISGRGIGMNAVRETVQRMTGSIQVDSEVGQGSTFTLNIPVSTAVQRVLKFRVGGETFGVLANQVDQIMTLQDTVLTETGGQRFFQYQGSQVPATWLQDLFNLPEQEVQEAGALQVVVVRHLEGYIGFLVNEVLEETQAVVKDVTSYLRRHAIQGLIGTTISGSGEVQLLLEPTGIKEMERTSPLTLKAGEVMAHDPLKGLRVLLVEDSPLARQMEKAVLENSGMEVDTAVDGLDALDRMEVLFPDIVISDVEMPRMDGYDLLRKLRDDDRYRGVPVFMVTSRDSDEDRNTAQQLGADGFLNKLDLQSGDLIEEIRGRLERLYA